MRKEKWEALTQEGQRARIERAASAPQAEPKSAERRKRNCRGDCEECPQEGEAHRHRDEAGLSAPAPAAPWGRDKHLWMQPRPLSSGGCTCSLGLKRTTPAPAAKRKRVRDYIDATVREFAGTPETATRLGFSTGRTRWTKAGLEGGNGERKRGRPSKQGSADGEGAKLGKSSVSSACSSSSSFSSSSEGG